MKTLIIYHAIKPGIDCSDGIAAAFVAKRKYPDADLLGHSYGEDVPDVSKCDELIIVDYSFSRDVLEGWRSQGKIITIIDHHKTALNDLSGFSGAIFDMKESGATLAWKTFFPNEEVPAWLQYVKDRDLWDFELPYSEEIHEAVSANGRSLAQIEEYCKLSQKQLIGLFADNGARLLAPKRARIAELAQSAEIIPVLASSVFVDSSGKRIERTGKAIATVIPEAEGRLISDLASFLYKQYPEVDFAVVATKYLVKEPNGWGLSFRSDKNGNNFDVSAIARAFGGGGHHNAAGGFIVAPDKEWVEIKEELS